MSIAAGDETTDARLILGSRRRRSPVTSRYGYHSPKAGAEGPIVGETDSSSDGTGVSLESRLGDGVVLDGPGVGVVPGPIGDGPGVVPGRVGVGVTLGAVGEGVTLEELGAGVFANGATEFSMTGNSGGTDGTLVPTIAVGPPDGEGVVSVPRYSSASRTKTKRYSQAEGMDDGATGMHAQVGVGWDEATDARAVNSWRR